MSLHRQSVKPVCELAIILDASSVIGLYNQLQHFESDAANYRPIIVASPERMIVTPRSTALTQLVLVNSIYDDDRVACVS